MSINELKKLAIEKVERLKKCNMSFEYIQANVGGMFFMYRNMVEMTPEQMDTYQGAYIEVLRHI